MKTEQPAKNKQRGSIAPIGATRKERKNPFLQKGAAHLANRDPMLTEERRQDIVTILRKDGRVIVSKLSKMYGVSEITVRKDLDVLQSRGMLERSRGGALLPQAHALLDLSLLEKRGRHNAEKRRIGMAAASLIRDGSCVMLDSGTTTAAVAEGLKQRKSLTIITNSLQIAEQFTDSEFDLILIGGTLRRNAASLVGPIAEDILKELHADVLFLATDGFDLEAGLTTPNQLEARVNRAMVAAARMVVVVCDSTKFGQKSLARIVPITAVHHVVTDEGLPKNFADELRARDIEVTLV